MDSEAGNNRTSLQARVVFSVQWIIEIVYSISSLFDFYQNHLAFVKGLFLWWRVLCIALLIGLQIAYQKSYSKQPRIRNERILAYITMFPFLTNWFQYSGIRVPPIQIVVLMVAWNAVFVFVWFTYWRKKRKEMKKTIGH